MDEIHPHNSKRDHAVTMGSDEKLDDKNRARYTLATPDKFGVALHPDVENLLFDSTALAHAYGGNCESSICRFGWAPYGTRLLWNERRSREHNANAQPSRTFSPRPS